MNPKIPVTQRDGLKDLSAKVGKPITELVEMAITRVLEGETTLPTKDVGGRVGISVYLPYEKEVALKTLSRESGVSVEEIYRVAIRELLATSQTLIDKAHDLAATQVAQQRRKADLLGRDEALMARRETLMAKQEAETEDVDVDVDPDEEAPRAYTRGLRKSRHH